MKKRFFRPTDHQYSPRGRSRGFGSGTLPQACYFRRYLLYLAQEVRRHGSPLSKAAQVT